jgi:hypothetical protein
MVMAGFQPSSSFKMDRQTVPDGYTFGWKSGGVNLPVVHAVVKVSRASPLPLISFPPRREGMRHKERGGAEEAEPVGSGETIKGGTDISVAL